MSAPLLSGIEEVMVCRGGPWHGRTVQIDEGADELVVVRPNGQVPVHYARTDEVAHYGDSEFGVLEFEDTQR